MFHSEGCSDATELQPGTARPQLNATPILDRWHANSSQTPKPTSRRDLGLAYAKTIKKPPKKKTATRQFGPNQTATPNPSVPTAAGNVCGAATGGNAVTKAKSSTAKFATSAKQPKHVSGVTASATPPDPCPMISKLTGQGSDENEMKSKGGLSSTHSGLQAATQVALKELREDQDFENRIGVLRDHFSDS